MEEKKIQNWHKDWIFDKGTLLGVELSKRLRLTLVNIFLTHTHWKNFTVFSSKEKLMFYFVAKANNQKFNCQLHSYRVTGWCSNARNENSLYFFLSLFFKLFFIYLNKTKQLNKKLNISLYLLSGYLFFGSIQNNRHGLIFRILTFK